MQRLYFEPNRKYQLVYFLFSSSVSGRSKELCMIKLFVRGGVVDGEEGSSERCLKWGGGWSLRDLSKNILKHGVGNGKSCS